MLASSPLSVYERQDERLRYFKSESQHLRQIRALKSKGTRPANTNKLSVANYEVTRVLGKGSFGVVKLVRQKMDGEPDAKEALKVDSAENDTLTPDIQKLFGAKRTPAMDLNKLKHEVYAMKVIRKSDMLRNSQEGHLRAERDFLVASANSQWVVPLIASFQDFNHLYLVMEYMVGGDFLGLLLREDVLPEWATKWYIAEMILCVEEAHKMKWIHRDVKPDNFLIASNGHLKISDFGLAFDGHWSHHQQYHNATRESLCQNLGLDVIGDAVDIESEQERNKKNLESVVTGRPYQPGDFAASASRPGGNLVIDKLNNGWKRRLAKSVVGTSQYMCPEVIRGDQYDGRCDWWSIGIILYECLYGRTPFYCDTRELTKKNIVQHEQTLGFPTYPRYHRPQSGNAKPLPPVSHSAIDLISSLLTEKETRLSCRRYKDNDLWHARRGRPIASRAARTSTSGTPYFVFDNDAEDIKNHSFFKGVEWSEMHLSRPPWMPVIGRDQSIARWFEDESEIVDSSGEGGTSDNPIPTPPTIAVTPATDNMIPTPSPATAQIGTCKQPEATATSSSISQDQDEPKQHVKEKKRPRDKILRDPDMAPTALAERKAKAFLGYTYRRPEGFDLSGMEERVGRKLVRASVYGLVGGAAA
ncbi:kinase-like protein [Tothia fuscella]|uniref:non-specific serine/threonine protein kinase n=1 Tax=Tothia fuscella TaxID=1048955 RepID=A0A9P4P2B0_9PEZI|nr:kinase-like protein [Tothia fuscella]